MAAAFDGAEELSIVNGLNVIAGDLQVYLPPNLRVRK